MILKKTRNILEDLYYEIIWHKNKMIDYIYNIKHGIINLIKWFPIVWTDRDWDYRYLYEVLYFKLSDIEKSLRNDTWHSNSDKYAKQIMTAKVLVKRLIDDNYFDVAFEKYGLKQHEDFYRKLSSEEKEIYSKCFEYEEYMKKQDREYLFKYMNKHIEKWWC